MPGGRKGCSSHASAPRRRPARGAVVDEQTGALAMRRNAIKAGRLDARHFSLLVFRPVVGASGLIAARAPAIVVGFCALARLVLFGWMAVALFPPGTDPRHRPIVGGVMYLALAVVTLAVCLVIRHHETH